MPPRLEWEQLPGKSSGGILWPYPQRIQTKTLVNYGYENEVLLPISLAPLSDIKLGSRVTFRANVKWLACREECVPGKTPVELVLPVSGGAPTGSPHAALFQKYDSQIPQPLPSGLEVKSSFRQGLFEIALAGNVSALGQDILFFPEQQNWIDPASPQMIDKQEKKWILKIKASDQLKSAPTELKGVLVSGRRAFEIDARFP